VSILLIGNLVINLWTISRLDLFEETQAADYYSCVNDAPSSDTLAMIKDKCGKFATFQLPAPGENAPFLVAPGHKLPVGSNALNFLSRLSFHAVAALGLFAIAVTPLCICSVFLMDKHHWRIVKDFIRGKGFPSVSSLRPDSSVAGQAVYD
jgi:hypothetical protein